MIETWVPIKQDPRYEVSDSGRIRNEQGYIKKPYARPNGRVYVNLYVDGVRKSFGVHSIVLESFTGPRPDGMEACHGNGKPSDNRLENLRWDTHAANIRDSLDHGTHHQANKELCKFGHQLSGTNVKIDSKGHRKCRSCKNARQQRYWHNAHNNAQLGIHDQKRIADEIYARQTL